MVVLAYLKLVRFPILVLIALIQYCIFEFIIKTLLLVNNFDTVLSESQLWQIIGATVLIAAGGYAINDYFDAKIDRINKPKTVVLDRIVPRRIAMFLHVALTTIGMVLAAWTLYQVGLFRLTSLFVFATFLLWYYSTNLKHRFLLGNLAIAFMAGFIPLIIGLIEVPLQNIAHPEVIKKYGAIFNIPAYWVIAYSLVLFFLTLSREISKDVIDMRGDKSVGCNTVPIRLGVPKTKWIIVTVNAILVVVLGYYYQKFLFVHDWKVILFLVLIIVMVIGQSALTLMARTRKMFQQAVRINNLATVLLLISTYLIKMSVEAYFQL